MFYRNILNELKKWAQKDNRKPLVIRGARQVGKTSSVLEFSKEFENFLHINLEDKDAAGLFTSQSGMENLMTAIYLYCNKEKKPGRILLFIDEIQFSPPAVARLRYFYEDKPEIFVIAAGSMLESLIDSHISFPVGRVEYMALRPCSFAEFLGAMGENAIQSALIENVIPEALHPKVITLFNLYTIVGGMPEAVSHFAQKRDLISISDIFDSLLNGYIDDVEKYSHNATMTNILRHIIKTGWNYAAQPISFAGFAGSAYKSREMGEAFRVLEKTMLAEMVYPSYSINIPILPQIKKFPKLIWLDTGLVNYSANIQKEVFGAKDIMDVWRGRIAEHIVAQEIISGDFRVSSKRHFWQRNKSGSDAEVDFIIQIDNKLVPVEVKSGHNSRLKSLHHYMEETNHQLAVRIWSRAFSVDDIRTPGGKKVRLFNVPFYYAAYLKNLIK